MLSRLEKTICTAIQQQRLLTFFYDGAQQTVEPHILAYKKEGALILYSWDLAEGSNAGWREFLVLNMTVPVIEEDCFEQPRAIYGRRDFEYGTVVCTNYNALDGRRML